jgi:hypothetical protein
MVDLLFDSTDDAKENYWVELMVARMVLQKAEILVLTKVEMMDAWVVEMVWLWAEQLVDSKELWFRWSREEIVSFFDR